MLEINIALGEKGARKLSVNSPRRLVDIVADESHCYFVKPNPKHNEPMRTRNKYPTGTKREITRATTTRFVLVWFLVG